jgi:Leucine-rich repeat (LRR) protein
VINLVKYSIFRKILCLIFIAIVFQIIYRSETKQISCEKILIYDYINKIHVKECICVDYTTIDSSNITMFTRDNSMEGMILNNNKKIFYLPDKIGDAYPNLIGLKAANCSIKDISRRSFKGLTKLEDLHLYYNQIQKVTSDTFEPLKKLKVLSLGETLKIQH